MQPSSAKSSWLERPVAPWLPIAWEHLLWLLLLVGVAATRFYDIDTRAMSHDETLHAYYSWLLSRGQGYIHNPMMHGTLQMHLVALSYFVFGASDVAARLPAALFGIAAVALMLPFRRWLGKLGALMAGVMIGLSPFMLYYSRYVRNEAFVVVWGLLMFLAIARYFETRQARWLYLLTAATALHYTTKETSYIYVAIALVFLGLQLLISLMRVEWARERDQRRFTFLVSLGAALLLAALWLLAFNQTRLGGLPGATAVPSDPNLPRTPGQTLSLAPMLLWGGGVGVLGGVAFLVGLWLAARSFGPSFRPRFPAFDLLIVLGTFVLPQLASFPVRAMGWDALDYSLQGLSHTAVFAVPLLLVMVVIGLAWDRRLWLVNAAIFFGIMGVFFTTFFTNGNGLFSGLYGSLGYWLEQQGVQRGGQPWYYYLLIQLPLYEFLPALATIAAGVIGLSGLRARKTQRAEALSHSEAVQPSAAGDPTRPPAVPVFGMVGFLGFWSVVSLAAYSAAGEKMPWLTVHVTLPMILLGGWAIAHIVQHIDWPQVVRSPRWVAWLLLPIAAISLVVVFAIGLGPRPPFRGMLLEELQSTTSFLESLGFAALSLWALWRLWRGLPFGQWLRMLVLEFFMLLGLLTLRAGWTASYINYGNGREFIDYAHSAQGVKTVMAQIQDISRRTADGLGVQVGYDNLVSWSFTWYFRDYHNQRFFGDQPSRDLVEVPVIVVGQGNFSKIDPLLARTHTYFEYVRMSWPMQEYFGLNWERIRNALSDPRYRKALWDIWFDRDYTEYGSLTGASYDLAQWPVSERMRLYVRRDIAATVWQYGVKPAAEVVIDPYAQSRKELAASVVFGSQGSSAGELQRPRAIAIARDGTVYVADTANHRIQHFDASGTWLGGWGTFGDVAAGSAPGGTFNEPWGIALAPDGKVLVADTWNHRIQVFQPDGTFVRMWGTLGQGASPQELYGPRAITVDERGRVFVVDTGNKRVMVYDEEGGYLTQVGSAGFEAGQFDEPVGISLTPAGDLVVADTWNRRVQVFRETGQGTFVFDRQWEIAGWVGQSLDNKPYIAAGADGRVWVTDPEGFRVLCFDENGGFLFTWGDFGRDAARFELPVGVAVDDEGNVWIVDTDTSRVLKFTPPVEAS